jgi:hypothetical protein
MNDIRVYRSKALAVAGVVVGAAMVMFARVSRAHAGQIEATTPVDPLIDIALMAVGALAVLFAIYWLLQRGPILTVNREGILCNVPGARAGLITWGEISDVKALTQNVIVVLKDTEAFIQRQPAGDAARMRKMAATGQIRIPAAMLSMSAQKLGGAVQRYRQELANPGSR